MQKRIKFGQWSLLVDLNETTADIDFVWHPKSDINKDIKIMSFGTYTDMSLIMTQFESDLRDKFTELYERIESESKLSQYYTSDDVTLNLYTVQNMVARTIDTINYDWLINNNRLLDDSVLSYTVSDMEHEITDDIIITYSYGVDITKLNNNDKTAKIYLNITSKSYGCIFENPTLLDGLDKFIEQKLLDHVTEMQNNLVNAICAVKSIRGTLIK